MLGHVDVGSDRSLRSMEHIVGSRAWKKRRWEEKESTFTQTKKSTFYDLERIILMTNLKLVEFPLI